MPPLAAPWTATPWTAAPVIAATAGRPRFTENIPGAVELVGPEDRIRGWARAADPAQPVRIRIMVGDETIGEGITDQPRSDLGGPHGFVIACTRPVTAGDILAGRVDVLAVAATGGSARLRPAEQALKDGLLDLLQQATGALGVTEIEVLIAALSQHPVMRRQHAAAEHKRALMQRGLDPALRVPNAAEVEAMLASLPVTVPPPGAPPPDWPVKLPAGHVSPDGTATVGHGGHLFLVDGSNGLLGQYLLPDNDRGVVESAEGWLRLIEKRTATCAALQARFLQVIIPEKATLLPEYMPRAVPVPTPLWRAIVTGVAANPALAPHCLPVLAALQRRGLREHAFSHLDTHITARGAPEVFFAICLALGLDRPFPEAPFTHQTRETGDLAERLFPGARLDEATVWPMPELLATWPEPTLVEKIDPDRHTGRRRVWRNPDAPIAGTMVVFGNSFFDLGGSARTLSWWCARAFSEFHFTWSPDMDEDYVRNANATWVVCQTVERFMPSVPAR